MTPYISVIFRSGSSWILGDSCLNLKLLLQQKFTTEIIRSFDPVVQQCYAHTIVGEWREITVKKETPLPIPIMVEWFTVGSGISSACCPTWMVQQRENHNNASIVVLLIFFLL